MITSKVIRESVPCRGRKRAAALGSVGLRAIERAPGVETGERLLIISQTGSRSLPNLVLLV